MERTNKKGVFFPMATKKRSSGGIGNRDFVTGLLYVAIGLLFCIFRSSVLNWLLTVVGILFILAGAVEILANKDYLSGIVFIILGVVLIWGSWQFLSIVLIVFGALYILKGIADLVRALQKKRRDPFAILSALAAIALGVLLIVLKINLLDWMFIVIGIIFIFEGVVTALSLRK